MARVTDMASLTEDIRELPERSNRSWVGNPASLRPDFDGAGAAHQRRLHFMMAGRKAGLGVNMTDTELQQAIDHNNVLQKQLNERHAQLCRVAGVAEALIILYKIGVNLDSTLDSLAQELEVLQHMIKSETEAA